MAKSYDILIVGAGAGGIATAASLLRRQPDLSICIVEPAEMHYYQPGWTMVGAGIFTAEQTARRTEELIPNGVTWVRQAATGFSPDSNSVTLADGSAIAYRILVVAAGLKLNWAGVKGLEAALGQGGVTSNYSYKTAPYTWKLVQELRRGRALFTQPAMPIKCAGAPQKALYLSCDTWLRAGVLGQIEVEFMQNTPAIFGVAYYVPSLMSYIEKYGVKLHSMTNLTELDGPARKAIFVQKKADGVETTIERTYDFIHVCPPQVAPDVIKQSPLANAAGWLEVDEATFQHKRFANVFGVGDVTGASNAKTAAAVRKQAPVVAENILGHLAGSGPRYIYDGYGSCPLTVERGKIVFAEFGYGGKLLPTFPLDGRVPRRSAWWLKTLVLPRLYWDYMLKGKEPLASPEARYVKAAG